MGDWVFTIRPSNRLPGPDPDELLRQDMLDELGSLRRRLALMLGQTESARRHREGAPGTPGARGGQYTRSSGGRYTRSTGRKNSPLVELVQTIDELEDALLDLRRKGII